MNSHSPNPVPQAPWDSDPGLHPFVSDTVRSVADTLYGRIASGQYAYGKRLPPERDLGDEFKCSRTIIRKSLEMLQSYGLISRQQGRSCHVIYRLAGSDVRPLPETHSDIAETTSPLELNVVRSIVEPEIVRLAIINMSARDMANLRAIVERMAAITTNAGDFVQCEEQFHLALAEGTNNKLLKAIYGLVNDVRQHAHWNTTRGKILSPNRIRDYRKIYWSICTALEERDMESAVEFVKLLMVEAQRDLTLET